MPAAMNRASGPVDNSRSANSVFRVLATGAVRFTDGFWAGRQTTNHRISLKHGFAMLNKAGNLHNLRMAAGLAAGEYRGMVFADETIYKWLEALAWELGRAPDAELQALADEAIALVEAAQQADGYLNSYYQVVEPGARWSDLDFGHELYCAGHLIQAAIAFARGPGDERLLKVVLRLVDHIDSVFGPGKREEACGHPEIEMALVELSRLTGQDRWLRLAQFFVDQRGKRKMRGWGANGPEYHQDHVAVRAADAVAGHAVRQAYLATAVADLYMETGEQALLAASHRLWNDMTGGKLYLTGGVGSRYDGEAFGESFELPSDQCYCETCAAIGSFFWNWRLLLVDGDGRYADLMERELYNGILSSPGLSGDVFFYVNPLMLRNGRYVRLSANQPEGHEISGRPAWHFVACCPPNVMRLLASLPHYFATGNETGIQIHQYSTMSVAHHPAEQPRIAFRVTTGYPWDGRVTIAIEESSEKPWRLALRIPGWCRSFGLNVNGREGYDSLQKGYAGVERIWKAGDVVELELAMPPFLVEADPRIDSTRGCLAIQRGPIVYCLEEHDQEPGVDLLDVEIDPLAELAARWQPELLGGVTIVDAAGQPMDRAGWVEGELYRPLVLRTAQRPAERRLKLRAIPYFAWANRGLKSMRVWIPRARG